MIGRLHGTIAISVFAAVLTAALYAGRACAEPTSTLSLRCEDGLVVLEAPVSEIENWGRKLAGPPSPPATIKGIYRWLVQNGATAGSIRLYADTSGKPDAGGRRKPAWTKTTVREAALAGDIPDIAGRELFEAYMLIRATGRKVYFVKAVDASDPIPAASGFPHSVFVLSSAASSRHFGIYVDGVEVSTSNTGYNLVAFTPDGKTISKAMGFDLYGDPGAGDRMAEFLNSQPEGTYLAAAVNIGPGVFLTLDAINALHKYGSKEFPDTQVLSSHAMFGRKGRPQGTAIEASAVNLASQVIVFDDSLFVSETELPDLSINEGGKLFALTGTGINDPIYILK